MYQQGIGFAFLAMFLPNTTTTTTTTTAAFIRR